MCDDAKVLWRGVHERAPEETPGTCSSLDPKPQSQAPPGFLAKDHDDEIARRIATAEAELRAAPKFGERIESRTREENLAALLALVARAQRRAAGRFQ